MLSSGWNGPVYTAPDCPAPIAADKLKSLPRNLACTATMDDIADYRFRLRSFSGGNSIEGDTPPTMMTTDHPADPAILKGFER